MEDVFPSHTRLAPFRGEDTSSLGHLSPNSRDVRSKSLKVGANYTSSGPDKELPSPTEGGYSNVVTPIKKRLDPEHLREEEINGTQDHILLGPKMWRSLIPIDKNGIIPSQEGQEMAREMMGAPREGKLVWR